MRVTAVLPAFNAESTLDAALDSIKQQSVPVSEVIVVDDASRDATSRVAENWTSRLPLILLRNDRNMGIAYSLRAAMERCTGDFAFRLDADDEWLSFHIKQLMDCAAHTPASVLYSARAQYVDDGGIPITLSRELQGSGVRRLLMWDNPLVHSATGFLVSAYRAVGGYSSSELWEDYDLWIRLLQVGEIAYARDPSVRYRVSSRSLSRQNRRKAISARWKCQRRAISAFWRSYPIHAIGCRVIGSVRAGLSRWI